jgi:hypothetical protein
MEPAHVTLKPRGHGRLGLLAIEAELDYRVVQREVCQQSNSPSRDLMKVIDLWARLGGPDGGGFAVDSSSIRRRLWVYRTPERTHARRRSRAYEADGSPRATREEAGEGSVRNPEWCRDVGRPLVPGEWELAIRVGLRWHTDTAAPSPRIPVE